MFGKNTKSSRTIISYTKALYETAAKNSILDVISKDLKKIVSFMNSEQRVYKIFVDPTIEKIKKQNLMLSISKELDFCKLTINFLLIVISNMRFNLILDVINYFDFLLSSKNGEKNIEITTAYKIENDEKIKLHQQLNKIFNSKIHLIENIDNSIIGGIIITDGTKRYDASIKSKLKNLVLKTKINIG